MRLRVLIASTALAATLPLSAHADAMTAKIKVWDPARMMLQMRSNEIFLIDPSKVEMPADLKEGDTVEIDYTSNDNGLIEVFSVKKKS